MSLSEHVNERLVVTLKRPLIHPELALTVSINTATSLANLPVAWTEKLDSCFKCFIFSKSVFRIYSPYANSLPSSQRLVNYFIYFILWGLTPSERSMSCSSWTDIMHKQSIACDPEDVLSLDFEVVDGLRCVLACCVLWLDAKHGGGTGKRR